METGEPVGSRTISKYPGLNVSSATVRNEMADLEDMGYIVQPHTSAGRIPTDKGYRLYVDLLMQDRLEDIRQREQDMDEKEADLNKQSALLFEKVDRVQQLLNRVADLLAQSTNYTTMITAPTAKHNTIKFLQLSMIDVRKMILVCVLQGNVIKNQIIIPDEPVEADVIFKLNMLLNTNLCGEVVDDISISQIMKLKEQSGEHADLMLMVIEALGNTLVEDDGLEIYSGGTSNILKYPELSAEGNIAGLLTELMEKDELAEFMIDANAEETGIQVYIGDETNVSTMQNCSIVTMNYEIQDGLKSTIGIIGPKRMNYKKVVRDLSEVKNQLDRIFSKHEDAGGKAEGNT
ncbi:MAG: heat-inducible transcriptional repressor HrcA [Eubacteriales bacterium]|nr:heat-inducible transcriptional repressor HrcA [Eubacteriales bacterium]